MRIIARGVVCVGRAGGQEDPHLIEHEHARALEQRAAHARELALADGEVGSARVDQPDEPVGMLARDAIERVIVPVYATPPKNANSKLIHAAACNALHCYLVQVHGWLINGMSPGGSAWNGSSTTTPMPERAPAHVQELLERHLGSRGLRLRVLAALASVMSARTPNVLFSAPLLKPMPLPML